MREVVLRLFFQGHATAAELERDLVGTRPDNELPGIRVSADYRFEHMAPEVQVTPECMIRLVDALLEGSLTEEDLGTVCFALECSDRFLWDADSPEGARVADSVFWLGMPEINYPLTRTVLEKIRVYLQTGENRLTPDTSR